ncbi:MAG: tetratricopeptide repeat protein [Spirochaetales bacterium]|nr:tetratricopeptide repeat protein [Spirochaetales bacterium]
MNKALERGIQSYSKGQYRKALHEFMEARTDRPEDCEISYYLGLCNVKLGMHEEALVYLEQTVTGSTNLLFIYQSRMILAFLYSITHRYKLAEFEIAKLLESGYESPQVFSAAAYVAYSQGLIGESVEYLEKALEIDGDNVNALNSLGYILAEEGIDTEAALDYCRRAVKKSPANPAYLDSFGWALYKAGKTAEARKYLKEALEKAGDNRVIQHHLGEVIKSLTESDR